MKETIEPITPKEKAIELVDKMSFETHKYNAMSCALIAVDELINNSIEWLGCKYQDEEIKYWEEVKQEIEKL